jgi:hypothetical protein
MKDVWQQGGDGRKTGRKNLLQTMKWSDTTDAVVHRQWK